MTTYGHVAGSMRKTIENLREDNVVLAKQLAEARAEVEARLERGEKIVESALATATQRVLAAEAEVARLRAEAAESERLALAYATEIGRLRAEGLAIADGQIADRERLEAEVERQGKLIVALETQCDPSGDLRNLILTRDENAMLRAALEIIAGKRQCLDNLMSNVDVALTALAQPEEKPKHASYCGDSRGPDPLCGGCGMPWPAPEVK